MNPSASSIRSFKGAGKSIRLAVALLFIVSFQGCKKADEGEAAALVTVQAEHPEVGSISERIAADATLSPLAQAAISPRIVAPVRTFYVQRGSKVKAGQLLAVLENRDLAAVELDNQGQYKAAQASYNIQTKAQVPEDLGKAESDTAQAKAQLDLQTQVVASRQKLFKEGAIAGREYDTAVAALAQAQAAYDVALNHLNAMKSVAGQAAIQQAQGQLSSAKGKYLAAQAQVSYSEIRSPIAGFVTDRPLFPGETANPGSSLITVMDTSSLLAKVHLSQTIAQRLTIGDQANISVPGIDDPVTAKVSLISPALDPGSTTVEVWLKVDNRAGQYKAGTPVHVLITGRTATNAIKLPLSSILTAQDGSKYVMTVGADTIAHKRLVTLGIVNNDDAQVTHGLNAQDMVITNGAYGLDEGTKVRIGKADDSDAAAGDDK
jgi:multidrug efflux pump subunit AcrA (membrane-fusion protein)